MAYKHNFMTLSDLEAFFEENGNLYQNENDIDIHLAGEFWISATLWTKAPVSFTLVLTIDENDPELGEKLGFTSAEDIKTLDTAYLWAQYRKGRAKVYANMDDLFGMTIVFQQEDGKTYVVKEGEESVVIEMLAEVSGQIDWFRAYIRNNAVRWYMMAEEGDVEPAVLL